ncbi:uncharacterized protein PRCAT00003365001 [Priceomyces carsonii]|uniref:uncharacterized protein n=1 Tax=Priceomyces carsonii TaxID=28549 RepID=UPI002ED9D6CC|nr:unnamed protein product [Priceomyces carsonii]
MSFYLIPSASYQMQQKMKKQKGGKSKHKSHKHSRASQKESGSISEPTSSKASLSSESTSSSISKIPPQVPAMEELNEVGADEVVSNTDVASLPASPARASSTSAFSIANQFWSNTDKLNRSSSQVSGKSNDSLSILSNKSADTTNQKFRANSDQYSSPKDLNISPKASDSNLNLSRNARQPSVVSTLSQDSMKEDRSKLRSPAIKIPSLKIPKFNLIIDLSVINSSQGIKENFYSPAFQLFRYNSFLELLNEHHRDDPINFATLRLQSLFKFILRHRSCKDLSISGQTYDVSYYEGILAHQLTCVRRFLRNLIRMQTEDRQKLAVKNCEELIMINFTNYVRYLVNLPDSLEVVLDELDNIIRTHYHFKHVFKVIGNALYTLKKVDTGEAISSNFKESLTLQSVTKVSYEYILLEMYLIHILAKLNNNSIIGSRIAKHLFEVYVERKKAENDDLVKVLFFNSSFSTQYSWFLALTIPFVRLIETDIYNEDKNLINAPDAYDEAEKDAEKDTFFKLDRELAKNYFSFLGFKDYELYKNSTPKELVQLLRNVERRSPVVEGVAKKRLPNPNATVSYGPRNFEHYSKSLMHLPSESFDLVHSRDIALNVTPRSYSIVLKQFYRILRVGGILEFPLFLLGEDAITKIQDMNSSYFPKRAKFMDLDLAEVFDLVPDIPQAFLRELSTLFGEENVRYGMVLLSSVNDMNSFLETQICFRLFEMLGKIDEFCSSKEVVGPNEAVHYLFYLTAKKC